MKRRFYAVAAVAAILTLSACSAPGPSTTTAATPGSTSAPSASVEATPNEGGAPKAPECESLIPSALVTSLDSLGLTVEAEPFRISGVEVEGGILCAWADYSVAGEQSQIFGWAPISAEDAEAAVESLIAEQWIREEGPTGPYLTQPEGTFNPARADAEGYGWTYQFGDGWVTMADTKESLLLINRPST